MERTLRATLLLCAVAGATTARAAQPPVGCDHAISTDVALSRTDDPDVPYEARVLIREEHTGAVLPLEYRLSRGMPIAGDITGPKGGVFPNMRVSLALAEDGSDVRYAIEILASGTACRSHRGLVPLAAPPQRKEGPRIVPLAPTGP